MQRLFSMFPMGVPGMALLLMRIIVLGMVFDSSLRSATSGNVDIWRTLSLIIIGVLLICGAFTPIASMISIIIHAANWPSWDGLSSFEFSLQALVMIALFLLGPGAYSIDSRLFGRRIILPPE